MKIILAFDNDKAGEQVVWRWLQNLVDSDLPYPRPREMGVNTYMEYLRILNYHGVDEEIERLIKEQDHNAEEKARCLDIIIGQWDEAFKEVEPLLKYPDPDNMPFFQGVTPFSVTFRNNPVTSVTDVTEIDTDSF